MPFTIDLDLEMDRSRMMAPEIDIERTVFIVMDMQNMCAHKDAMAYVPSINGAPAGDEVIAPIVRCVERCREVGIPIIWSKWGFRSDELDVGTFPLKAAELVQPGSFGTWEAELVDELQPLEGEPVIEKPGRASTFSFTSLPVYLRQLNAEFVVIGGLSATHCVYGTAVDASILNYKPIVLADCTTAMTVETKPGAVPNHATLHFLRNVQVLYGDVRTSDEFLGMVDEAKARQDAQTSQPVGSAV
jgi:nicotinamidase-related amidase